jgi:hypothetical protein
MDLSTARSSATEDVDANCDVAVYTGRQPPGHTLSIRGSHALTCRSMRRHHSTLPALRASGAPKCGYSSGRGRGDGYPPPRMDPYLQHYRNKCDRPHFASGSRTGHHAFVHGRFTTMDQSKARDRSARGGVRMDSSRLWNGGYRVMKFRQRVSLLAGCAWTSS